MIRTAIGICATLAVCMLSTSMLAQNHFVGSGFTFFPPPAAPAALSWRLATEEGQFVELAVPSVEHSSRQIVHFVTPENAPDYGLDFAAWTAAVNNSAYNRSIVSFGGILKEQAWSNPWRDAFGLERIQLFVNSFDGISSSSSVQGGVVDFIQHIPGDFNWDGFVDMRDYLRWRNGTDWLYHATRPDGKPVPEDYELWRAHYGLNDWEPLPWSASSASVPETSTIILAVAAIFLAGTNVRRLCGCRVCRSRSASCSTSDHLAR
jgi:hypothetical protein